MWLSTFFSFGRAGHAAATPKMGCDAKIPRAAAAAAAAVSRSRSGLSLRCAASNQTDRAGKWVIAVKTAIGDRLSALAKDDRTRETRRRRRTTPTEITPGRSRGRERRRQIAARNGPSVPSRRIESPGLDSRSTNAFFAPVDIDGGARWRNVNESLSPVLDEATVLHFSFSHLSLSYSYTRAHIRSKSIIATRLFLRAK